ncbi:MAG: glucose-6-phosphate dehydrogenase [Acidobacteriota bacterium]|nr:glucose-6-phosphate dehydrogenase [Acidobacteriota bacterium]
MSATVEATCVDRTASPPPPQGDSCVLVIFGASGDLTRRKLIPALYDLACIGCMHPHFEVLGTGRTPMTTEEFRAKMREAAATSKETRDFSEARWADFEKRLFYLPGDSSDADFYPRLRAKLEEMRSAGGSGNHLFYVSTPASVAHRVLEGLGAAGLNRDPNGWSRIVLEKPFGRDLCTARELNATVARIFPERDVYRIDHYLGKETVQNMLVFRFANSLFEPVWNRNYIDYVEITAAEAVGVENRAAFYEETGALRDMVANHLLQLLAITAMEPPIAFDADAIREQKVQVFRSIHPMTREEVMRRTVRGQYGPGEIAGHAVPGYRSEPGVNPSSSTETFVAIEFHVDNWRWAGVPFYVRTGKRLARQWTEVRVHFKRTPQALFSRTPAEQIESNMVVIGIQPDEGIVLQFGAKKPGSHMQVVPVEANFSYRTAFDGSAPDAYETLLLDAMRGDATLFTRGDEIEAEWSIITPIEEAWAQLPPPGFPNYAAGSDGPEAANELIRRELRGWHAVAPARGGAAYVKA